MWWTGYWVPAAQKFRSKPCPNRRNGRVPPTKKRPARHRKHRTGRRKNGWQRRTLPPGCPSSTIRAAGLNFRVRDGIGCDPCAVATNQEGAVRGETRPAVGADSPGTARVEGRTCLMSVLEVRRRMAGQACRAISTARLHVSPRFHLPPINVLVSHGPSRTPKGPGSTHLGGGFPLRCFQRLSLPDVATRRCPWRNSRYTSGQSTPVLSY